MAKVDIIMTVYNQPRWLRQSINSVIEQDFNDWKLIIMEDNSPDPAIRDILSDYEHHPKIEVWYSKVTEEERYSTARYATLINEAVTHHSNSPLLSYLTDDDFYYRYRITRMVDKLATDSKISVVYGAQHFVDAAGTVAGYRKTLGVLSNAWNKVDHTSVMHTRASFDAVGGWDDHQGAWGGADSYFWRRLTDAGYQFYPLDDDMPNECKRYHVDSVQWKISNKIFFPE